MTQRKLHNLFFCLKDILSGMLFKEGLLIFCLLVPSLYVTAAIEETIDIELSPVVSFDEVPVNFNVNDYLKFETDVIITESNKVYINIEELFENLGIKCVSENKGNNLSGFIENEKKTYNIDFSDKYITIGNKKINAPNGFLKESGGIYVESTIITGVFGLDVIFNYRSLSIKMDSDFELPLLKQMRLEQMRQNVSKLQSKAEVIIDTVIGRNYHLFNGGVVDWSLSSSQTQNEKSNHRVSVKAGSELLYGEATVGVDYYSQTDFDKRQLYYNWRWVDNDNPVVKQAQLGKVGVQSIAYLKAPLVGASINNSPNTIRKATGTYLISDYTEPNWTVELYINDALVDYTEADASGFYLFKVPIVYGYTTLKLKFYGPLGEERMEKRTMNTPYTFMPAGTMEYNVTGGVIEDELNSEFGRGVVNYGLNRFVTIGGGVEYYSNIPEHAVIPFAMMSFQPFSRMVVNLEYDHNVVMNGLLNYTFAKSAFLEIDYSKYTKGQRATLNATNEELQARFSFPYKINKITGNTKLIYNKLGYDSFSFNQLNAVFSGRLKNLSANATIASNWTTDKDPYMTGTLDLSYRMRNGLIIRPTAQYNITAQEMLRTRVELEKRFARMSLSASYERNFHNNSDNVFFSLRYDLPFARTGVTAAYSNNRVSLSENAQGSLAFGGDHFTNTNNNTSIDKGGILFYPFLDLNQNGVKDKDEQMVLLSNVRVSGGRAFISKKDSIVRVSDLNAFINYTVQFSDNDLDHIAWQFKKKNYQVLVDPHQYKRIYMPILSMGEVSGMVYLNREGITKGIGRITVQIVDKNGVVVAETLSESDGYFSYLGLKSGDYTVRIDETQLNVLDYQTTPLLHHSHIKQLVEGDIVGGLDFVLQSKEIISAIKITEKEMLNGNEKASRKNELFVINENRKEASKEIKADSIGGDTLSQTMSPLSDSVDEVPLSEDLASSVLDRPGEISKVQGAEVLEITRSNINTSFTDISITDEFFYTVQIGIYRNFVTADQLKNLMPIYYEVLKNGTNRYFSGCYNTVEEAIEARNEILEKGVKGAYVLSYENGEETASYDLDLEKEKLDSVVNVESENDTPQVAVEAVKDIVSENGEQDEDVAVNSSKLSTKKGLWKQDSNTILLSMALLLILGLGFLFKSKDEKLS